MCEIFPQWPSLVCVQVKWDSSKSLGEMKGVKKVISEDGEFGWGVVLGKMKGVKKGISEEREYGAYSFFYFDLHQFIYYNCVHIINI